MKTNNLLILLSFILGLWLLPVSVFSLVTPSNIEIKKANELISNENWNEGILLYQKWINNGQNTRDVYFNLSLLYLKKNDLGKSMYYLKKAEKLNPSDVTVKNQILLIQEKLKDKFMIPIQTISYFDFLLKPWNYWSFGVLGLILMVSIWFLFLQFIISKKYKWNRNSKYYKTLVVCFFLMGSISMIQMIRIYNFREQKQFIVLSEEAKIHQGADSISPIIQTVHAGLPVLFENEIGLWKKVKLANGQSGWILKKHLSAQI